MCGITGWVDRSRDLTRERAVITAMTATMACRGPDAEGVWVSEHAAVGHRRLAVIDIRGGVQPMSAADGRTMSRHADRAPQAVLTYSGEIYNYRELRRELEAHGHAFRTYSDTEVLLHAFLQWGSDCVRRLNGMFAFAVWSPATRELLLARDRLGIKPLYYTVYDGGLIFASEPKALLENPLFTPELGDEELAELLGMWPFKSPGHGILRGVRELRPGHLLRMTEHGTTEQRYWELESRPHTDDLDTTVAHVKGLLEDIVARQLISDVPLCALLSGGLDSSLMTALAVRRLEGSGEGPLTTFSVDFSGAERDFVPSLDRPSRDAPYARTTAAHLGTRHTDIVVGAPDLRDAEHTTMRARSLPTMGDMDASLYLLFREVRRHSTVALSGESADEIFGGYAWFAEEARAPSGTFPWLRLRAGAADAISPELRQRIRLAEYVADRYADAIAQVPALPGETDAARHMREVCHLNLTHFLPALLDRKDRMSMAVGLEVRVPYCDHRLVEYLWNVPWEMKTADGVEKGLLRRAAAGLVPEEIRTRPKSGYPVPQDFAYAADLVERVKAMLADSASPLAPLLNAPWWSELLAALAGQPYGLGSVTAMASLLSMDDWLRTYGVRIR